MTHIRIYDTSKTKGARGHHACTLALVGTFPNYTSTLAYEGRLQIEDAEGDSSVRITSSTNLPNGTTVTVDNATQEVVVAWPAYEVLSLTNPDVVNSGFELGDVNWVKGFKWTIGAYAVDQVFSGTKSAQFGPGLKGSSRITSAQPRECVPTTSVIASCQVQQGRSDAGYAGAWVFLEFLNTNGAVLQHSIGNKVTSGSNSAWHISSVTATAPANTTHVRIGSEAFRRKQDFKLWVDAFTWNLPATVAEFIGTNDTLPISLCVEVTDALGCIANWCGDIALQGLVITGTLANGTVSVAYSSNLTISEGIPPYSGHSIISGTLPAGVTLTTSTGATITFAGTPT